MQRGDPLFQGAVRDAGGYVAGAPPVVVGVDEQSEQDERPGCVGAVVSHRRQVLRLMTPSRTAGPGP